MNDHREGRGNSVNRSRTSNLPWNSRPSEASCSHVWDCVCRIKMVLQSCLMILVTELIALNKKSFSLINTAWQLEHRRRRDLCGRVRVHSNILGEFRDFTLGTNDFDEERTCYVKQAGLHLGM